jgi:phosphotransferase system  glucose/maltose/N-acetylglucosamine-specific IIC component
MTPDRSVFSERSQRAILWWGIVMAIVYLIAFAFLIRQVPLKNPAWTAEEVADWYAHNSTPIKWGR